MSSMALYKAIPDFCRYHHAHQRGKMSTHFRAHRGAKNTNETELEIIVSISSYFSALSERFDVSLW